MEIFFDEAGDFAPPARDSEKISVVMGLIIPESESQALNNDFDAFVRELSPKEFATDEPKGHLLTPLHRELLARILNVHSAAMLVPVTVDLGLIPEIFLRSFPDQLRSVLEREGDKCLYDTMRVQVGELARRCSNLSPDQLVRLMALTIGVQRAVNGIALSYHCQKFHSMYCPIKVVIDRTGAPNSREELVFKDLLFMWLMKWTERYPITTIKERHTSTHPFVALYRTEFEGRAGIDLSKMLRGNISFADSKSTWQLRLADMFANLWLNVVRDYNNTGGHLPLFRILHKNTVLPNDQPLGMMSVAAKASEAIAPVHFNIFPEMASTEHKLLPCSWDEK